MNIHQSGVLTAPAWLVRQETAAVSAHSVYTFCAFSVHHTTMHIVTSCKATHVGPKVYACLAVTCLLHFWQNDTDLLHAAVVTRWWNGYRSKSRHRKVTLEKKFLPPLLPGLEPETFHSTTELSPLLQQSDASSVRTTPL